MQSALPNSDTDKNIGYPKHACFKSLDRAKPDPIIKTAILKSATLAELSREFAVVSYTALMRFGGLRFDPLRQAIAELSIKTHIAVARSSFPVFQGFHSQWDYAVTLIPLEVWSPVRSYLDSVVAIDSTSRIYRKVLRQDLPMVDFLALGKITSLPKLLPWVSLTTYGVDGNDHCVHFVPAQQPPSDCIILHQDEPMPETVWMADSYFSKVSSCRK